MYEINHWLWQFRRGKPRLGGLSVAETEERPGPEGSQGGRGPGRTGICYPWPWNIPDTNTCDLDIPYI